MIGQMAGSFRITEIIGEGGMGAVYKGIDVMLEREVAIKMLRPELARQPSLVERFRTEAVTLAKLNHPNIATLYTFLRQGDDLFMVMEYVRGETLDSFLRRTGAMPLQQALRIFCRALDGIEHAHEMGIVHRDIKPSNMMLTANGSIKVMDFGIARVLGADRMTRTGHLVGTVEYMSPEQVKGEETDARSDIYSLGMVLYEMLTGRLPFNATSEYELMRSQIEAAPTPPTEFAPGIPLEVEKAIMRALAKRPDARHQTTGHFRAALEPALGSLVEPARIVEQAEAARTTQSAPSPGLPPQPAQGVVPKETRLAPQIPVSAPPGYPKETRLAAAADQLSAGHFEYQHSTYQHRPSSAQPSHRSGSWLNRLNWKHYTLVGALFFSLLALPIVLLTATTRRPVAEQQPAAPVTRQPDQTPPAAAPLVGPNTPTTPIPEDKAADNPINAGSRRSITSRDARSAQPRTERRIQTASEQRPDDPRAAAVPREPSSPPAAREATSGQESTVRAEDDEKKGKARKIGEATEAVGGAIKKLGGLFGRKKKEKH